MADNHDSPSSARRAAHFSLLDLRSLVESLYQLYLSVASRIMSQRTQAREPSPLAGDSAEIVDSLREHIDKAETEFETGEPSGSEAGAGRAAQLQPDGGANVARKPSGKRPSTGFLDGLARRFSRGGGKLGFQPDFGVKMQTKTLEHINKAAQLARQGNARGARIHAEFAENAMRTSSEYLSEEDYLEFKQQVETKLKKIVKQS